MFYFFCQCVSSIPCIYAPLISFSVLLALWSIALVDCFDVIVDPPLPLAFSTFTATWLHDLGDPVEGTVDLILLYPNQTNVTVTSPVQPGLNEGSVSMVAGEAG